MSTDKKGETKQAASEEPNTRFYVRPWDATPEEEAEISQFIRERKDKHSPNGQGMSQSQAKEIMKKITR
jgi:hypothetical protein